MPNDVPLILWFADIGRTDTARVGGKNSSLGEMIGRLREGGVRVPDGFATTADAYWAFIDANNLRERLTQTLASLGPDRGNVAQVGAAARAMILEAQLPQTLASAITDAYAELGRKGRRRRPTVAVRSSATAEDLPEASFAGQLETFLNIRGEEALTEACKRCFASLFTDRAIIYRENNKFEHVNVALSVGVQEMVRSDVGGAGVMFSIDTETGFPRSVIINAAWGLGETVVQGMVDPDEYQVFKPLLDNPGVKPIVEKKLGSKGKKMVYARSRRRPTRLARTSRKERRTFVLEDDEVVQLARWARVIEEHYGQAMDMEWAKDGKTGELFIVQARPETVQSRKDAGALTSYRLLESKEPLLKGHAIGDAIASGKVCRLASAGDIDRFEPGSVLVTGMTDPDWVPIMRKAAAIVTDHGGRTSHAAIVSRELGLAAIVGTGNATSLLKPGREITVSCAEGDAGFVYDGKLRYEVQELDLGDLPETRTQVMINLGNPAAAYRWWRLPADGVGLARTEFIIGNVIRVHPMALVRFPKLQDRRARRAIKELTRGYGDKTEYFVERLARGMARLAAAYHPKPVIVRASDFKTNEYAELLGGAEFEPREENPMLGWRGASRYYSEGYRAGFALECRAVRRAREEMGLDNIVLMIPFCRTLEEADRVFEELAANGLQRGKHGLKVYVMIEIPSNVLLAERFGERFDGFSIGSNDLTQLILGVDRDSAVLAELFDERDEAVTTAIADLLARTARTGTPTGICGQAPSDHPGFAGFLVEHGISSISVSPDKFLSVKQSVAEVEARGAAGAAAG
jgi:pyruvate, water dikinase